MKADGLTPLQILQQPQRLMVPLFQRPYVWARDTQWEPLWEDIVRMADGVAGNLMAPPKPHFLGAIVLQQRNVPIQALPQRWVIDGQQRLTTLQIVIDAVQARLEIEGFTSQAGRLRNLIENEPQYRQGDDDIFKLWPTNRDRDAYREVMVATPPIDYDSLQHRGERIVEAHQFFSDSALEYLRAPGDLDVSRRADALEIALKQLLKLVVIDLDVDEDAQEIFETLNSRGVKLSSADLIKNLIFQRLEDEGENTENAYERYWSRFETAFWEVVIVAGRLKQPRTAVFLNQFLIARTGDVVTAEQVFYKFKEYLESSGLTTMQLLRQVHEVAEIYETHVKNALSSSNELGPIDLFLYRTQVMDAELVKSLLIYLLDPAMEPISEDEIVLSLAYVESWLVRRSLMRSTTKAVNRFMAQLIATLLASDRSKASETIARHLASQGGESGYWPDNAQVAEQLISLRLYQLLPRPRVRMILEALEDDARGYRYGASPKAEQRCPRDSLTIEHVMPQRWKGVWPLPADETEDERNRALHKLGNLTLLTGKLNAGVSNGKWLGQEGKREGLNAHSALLLNSEIVMGSPEDWNLESILDRTRELTRRILEIWPVPDGHRAISGTPAPAPGVRVSVSNLISAGLLESGDVLIPTWSSLEHRSAVVRPNGWLELDTGEVQKSLSGAGKVLTRTTSLPGWSFWRHSATGRILSDLRSEYRARFDILIESDDETDLDDGDSPAGL
jgi:hypothetical protein